MDGSSSGFRNSRAGPTAERADFSRSMVVCGGSVREAQTPHVGNGKTPRFPEALNMSDSQESMVYIVAVVAIMILVGIVIWFIQQESNDGLQIEIGTPIPELVAPTSGGVFV